MELLPEDIEKYAAIQLLEMHRAWLNITNFSILNLNFESAIIPGGNSTVDETVPTLLAREPSLPHFLHPRDYKTHQAVSGPSNRTKHSSETQVIYLWRSMVWSGRIHGIIHRDRFLTFGLKLTEDTPLIQRRLSANCSNDKRNDRCHGRVEAWF
ncbi:hypothetical protein PROFUN_08955 [Planoprotostelium fungivorum]|uniref:Uncharacterized protein n=1 Tax=Planoprotostelium fungivorum TaxID=1890364 RepID=A0A2P6NIQ8_9EUKA|nr:hypothetical protein PROFUN_08955 [Planoprotostelium fungivorum]